MSEEIHYVLWKVKDGKKLRIIGCGSLCEGETVVMEKRRVTRIVQKISEEPVEEETTRG
ncbi:MAG: hypothetical protein OEZ48_00095 [Candidatus Bathyarchaeota archaeon]|nr:hypothetical protein [Candidatus Bathyarchaeota archaeon]MDH5686256.1 hypothetical protein [Candidatus Bathyarchaeota archaeon]